MAKTLTLRQQALQPEHLLDNFTAGQISIDSIQTTSTKNTPHRTANLATDANRSTVTIAEKHAFNSPSLGPLQKQFLRAILSLLMSDNG